MNRTGKQVMLAIACAALVTGTAWAGGKQAYPVYVSPTGRTANGDLSSTRNTSDNSSYIGCFIDVYSSGTSPLGTCYASDAAGNFAMCRTNSSTLIQALHALNGDSFVMFTYDLSGNCTEIFIRNVSYSPPKNP
jgi:hypothetical protein